MSAYQDGQKVVVRKYTGGDWIRAVVVDSYHGDGFLTYVVEFSSGVRVAFDAANVRAAL